MEKAKRRRKIGEALAKRRQECYRIPAATNIAGGGGDGDKGDYVPYHIPHHSFLQYRLLSLQLQSMYYLFVNVSFVKCFGTNGAHPL